MGTDIISWTGTSLMATLAALTAGDMIVMLIMVAFGIWFLGQFVRVIRNISMGRRPFASAI